MRFFLNIFRKKRIRPFWPTKQAGNAYQHCKEVSLRIRQKGRPGKCKNQKCRTGHGEKETLLHWWVGCKLTMATLEKCMVFPKTSKNQLQSIRHFHSGAYILRKPKIDRTQAPQNLGLLCLQGPQLQYTLNIPWKRKMDKEVVVFMYNGISLSQEINVIRLVAALWADLSTMILSEISHREKETYHKISLIGDFEKSLHMTWITKQNRVTHLENTLMAA